MPNIRGALQLLSKVLSPGAQEAREALYYPPIRGIKLKELSPNEFNQRMVASEMFGEADSTPTTLLRTPEGLAAAAYQLKQEPGKEGTMLSYLLSKIPGAGSQALEHAYQAAQAKPVYLHAIPGSEEFYRKQLPKGWIELDDNGIPKFMRYAKGGLAQMRG